MEHFLYVESSFFNCCSVGNRFLTFKMYMMYICTGCPKKNVPVIFPVTTGTNTLGTWKTKTDMESLLSQLFIVYSVFILPLSNRQHSYDNEHHPYSTVLCSGSHVVTEQCEYPALYHVPLHTSNIKNFLKVQSVCQPTPLLMCLSGLHLSINQHLSFQESCIQHITHAL